MTKSKQIVVVRAPTKSGKSKRNKKQRAEKLAEKELTRLGYALRALGSLGGGSAGAMIGMPSLGRQMGTSLGASLSRWLGSGSYKVSTNSIVNRRGGSDTIPAMHSNSQSIVIRHREYLCEVSGSTAFTVQRAFALQPGISASFPWLARIAAQFQQYKLRGVVYHYIPTSGSVTGTNPSLGSVMMQTAYRTGEDYPKSKVELLNEYYACEAVPSEGFCHPIECDPRENLFSVHYVRTSTVPGVDPNLYDMGTMFLATSGMLEDGHVVGDLWVTYEIELMKPVVVSGASDPTPSIVLHGTAGTSGTILFGTLTTTSGTLAVTAATRTVTFAVGTIGDYIIMYQADGITTALGGIGVSTFTNCANYLLGGNTYLVGPNTSVTTSSFVYAVGVSITDPSKVATVLLPGLTWTGSLSTWTLSVTAI